MIGGPEGQAWHGAHALKRVQALQAWTQGLSKPGAWVMGPGTLTARN